MRGQMVMSWPSMTWNSADVLLLLLLASSLDSMFSISTMRGPDESSASSDSDMPPIGENSAFTCCAAVAAADTALRC